LACQPANHRSERAEPVRFKFLSSTSIAGRRLPLKTGLAAAQEICRDADLRTDLAALTSDGVPVCGPNSALSLRIAAPEEIAAFRLAVERGPASGQPTMAFLTNIDGVMVVTVVPEQD